MSKRRGREERPVQTARPAPVLPSADAGESGQRSRAWELVRIAYEEHFALGPQKLGCVGLSRFSSATTKA